MNPLFFADWGHIHRVFRALMWIVATALVCIICFAVTSRAAAGMRSHAAPRAALAYAGSRH